MIALNRWARYLFIAHTHHHHHHSAERTHVSIISYWVGNWVTLRTSSYVFQCTTELRSIAQSFHLLDWAEKKLVNRLFYFPKCSFLGWSFGYDHVRLAGFIVVCSLAGPASWLAGWLDGMSVLTGMCGCQAMNLKNVNECYFIATLAFDAKKKISENVRSYIRIRWEAQRLPKTRWRLRKPKATHPKNLTKCFTLFYGFSGGSGLKLNLRLK